MPSPISIQCPHCLQTIKLKSRKQLGRKVPCPKCKTPFVLEEPETEEDDFDVFADSGDDDEYNEPPARRRRTEGSRGKGKRQKSKSAAQPGADIHARLAAATHSVWPWVKVVRSFRLSGAISAADKAALYTSWGCPTSPEEVEAAESYKESYNREEMEAAGRKFKKLTRLQACQIYLDVDKTRWNQLSEHEQRVVWQKSGLIERFSGRYGENSPVGYENIPSEFYSTPEGRPYRWLMFRLQSPLPWFCYGWGALAWLVWVVGGFCLFFLWIMPHFLGR